MNLLKLKLDLRVNNPLIMINEINIYHGHKIFYGMADANDLTISINSKMGQVG